MTQQPAKPSKPRFCPTDRIGVNAVEHIFLSDFGWIPRAQLESDMGIDSQVEICDKGEPTGKLLAVQIKTGSSFFDEIKDGCVVYRGDKLHYDYWTKHSLPVLLVLHDPRTNITIWQHINKKNVVLLKNGWKTSIPLTHKLSSEHALEIAKIAEGPESIQRLRRLQLDKPLLERLANGEDLILDFQDMHNKSLSRTPLTMYVREDDEETEIWSSFAWYVGDIEFMLSYLFPWADAEVDDEFYDLNLEEDEVCDVYGSREYWNRIYPYTTEFMEVSYYRVKFTLNELGKAFLLLDEYLENGPNA